MDDHKTTGQTSASHGPGPSHTNCVKLTIKVVSGDQLAPADPDMVGPQPNSPEDAVLTVQYNPAELTFGKNVVWQSERMLYGGGNSMWMGNNEQRLDLDLLFDVYEDYDEDLADSQDVHQKYVARIIRFSKEALQLATEDDVKKRDRARNEGAKDKDGKPVPELKIGGAVTRPPQLDVCFGSLPRFRGVISSLATTYTMFSDLGVPLRAQVRLVLTGGDYAPEKRGGTKAAKEPPEERESLQYDLNAEMERSPVPPVGGKVAWGGGLGKALGIAGLAGATAMPFAPGSGTSGESTFSALGQPGGLNGGGASAFGSLAPGSGPVVMAGGPNSSLGGGGLGGFGGKELGSVATSGSGDGFGGGLGDAVGSPLGESGGGSVMGSGGGTRLVGGRSQSDNPLDMLQDLESEVAGAETRVEGETNKVTNPRTRR